MYLPAHFEEPDVPTLHALIRAHPLATLVTLDGGELTANHIPMLIDPEPSPWGTLRGHVARANPVWEAARDRAALAVFVGPQTYVTPSWYQTKREHGRVVPTWNYAVVHVHGPLRAIDDREWLRAFVTRLTDTHEAGRSPVWHVTDAPAEHVDRLLGSIVGLEIPVARMVGKWKVSQNQHAANRAGVVSGLRAESDDDSRAMADLVERVRDPG
jgi:transcriptional regulator